MNDENLKTAEENYIIDLITDLATGETPVDYVKGLADQLRGSEDILMGPSDSDLCAIALDRLAASL